MATTTASIFDSFSQQATECQSKALFLIEEFLQDPLNKQIFVLRGSAGTGKTSLMQAVVKYLKSIELGFVLLAPTGKAVKVLSKRANDIASTIHYQIYSSEELADGTIKFNYQPNTNSGRTVFIVDEASMLQAKREEDTKDFVTPNPILFDLVRHIKEGNPQNQIIFIGDTYQLPPVNENDSVALSARHLYETFDMPAQQTTLKEVVRQTNDSPVLKLANEIKARKDAAKDLRYISLGRLTNEQTSIRYFLQNFDRKKLENVIFIAQSNKDVQRLNTEIRDALGLNNHTLSEGDVVMLNRNWKGKSKAASKGDIGVVMEVGKVIEKKGNFSFVDAVIDFEGNMIDSKILINTLVSEKGEVDKDEMKLLKGDRMRFNDEYRNSEKASDDPYMSAMHLRYGYAITCHKAQGSEWNKVLIAPKFHLLNHRWLYTAVTRAKSEVRSWWY